MISPESSFDEPPPKVSSGIEYEAPGRDSYQDVALACAKWLDSRGLRTSFMMNQGAEVSEAKARRQKNAHVSIFD